ncbi:MAG TPA: sugar ABC transporter permease [Clostridiaceae bacterium]|nr:sugar ABC transporter permease [Clostridiaceae bacterium]
MKANNTGRAIKANQSFPGAVKEFFKGKEVILFLFPAIIYYLVFHYGPLYFLQIAFKDFRITRNVFDLPWVGFKHFESLFTNSFFWRALKNTLILNMLKLFFSWPVPILMALALNEIKNQVFKRSIQTIVYLPHFISWVVIVGLIYSLTTLNGGMINKIIEIFGGKPVLFLGKKEYFRTISILSVIWRESGWGSIIYLAAITAIDPTLYESAYIDGASRFRRIWHITLPGIKNIIIALLIIRVGQTLTVGFEQVLALQNEMTLEVSDILDTFIWRVGLKQGRYSFAAAAGFFQTIVAAILLATADRIAKKFGEHGIF